MEQAASSERSRASRDGTPGPGLRRRGAGLRGRKEDWIEEIEVALAPHPLHEHGADHAAPPDEAHADRCPSPVTCTVVRCHKSGVHRQKPPTNKKPALLSQRRVPGAVEAG